MQPQSGIEKEDPKTGNFLIKGVKDNISKIAWGGAIIGGVVAYLSIRHWIDTEAKSDTRRIEELLRERDEAEEQRRKLELERNEAQSKLAAEEAKARRAEEDRLAFENEKEAAQRAYSEAEERLKKLNNELNTKVVDVIAEPGVIVPVDLNAVNTQFNCFIDAANAGEENTTCYGE